MRQTTATDFMLYSLLGVSGDDECPILVDAAIDRAYQDASSHVLSIDGGNDSAKAAGKKAIERAIEGYPCKAFDDWHDSLCLILSGSDREPKPITSQPHITYGIAQKWVNMTLKYLAVVHEGVRDRNGAFDDYFNERFGADATEGEASFHIPIDKYIASALCFLGEEDHRDDTDALMPRREGFAGKNLSGYAHPYDKIVPWSQWRRDNYLKFRKALPHEYNLEWESRAWELVSKYENGSLTLNELKQMLPKPAN